LIYDKDLYMHKLLHSITALARVSPFPFLQLHLILHHQMNMSLPATDKPTESDIRDHLLTAQCNSDAKDQTHLHLFPVPKPSSRGKYTQVEYIPVFLTNRAVSPPQSSLDCND